jgi:hypothetical protein
MSYDLNQDTQIEITVTNVTIKIDIYDTIEELKGENVNDRMGKAVNFLAEKFGGKITRTVALNLIYALEEAKVEFEKKFVTLQKSASTLGLTPEKTDTA